MPLYEISRILFNMAHILAILSLKFQATTWHHPIQHLYGHRPASNLQHNKARLLMSYKQCWLSLCTALSYIAQYYIHS